MNIGDKINGGFVFYVDKTKTHGLMVSEFDQGITVWGGPETLVNKTEVGFEAKDNKDPVGLKNTLEILSKGITKHHKQEPKNKVRFAKFEKKSHHQKATSQKIAAELCVNYRGGEFSDWFLPSKDELNLIYQNIPSIMTPNYYWSSSEIDADHAWQQHFQTGTKLSADKILIAHVRAIRKF